jgi:hypothetical protein
MGRRQACIAGVALALGAAGLLGACNSGGGGSGGFKQTVQNGDSTGRVDMDHPKVPAKFPSSEVPLPQEGTLQAVVSGGRHFYSLTYSLAGKNGRAVGSEYRRVLEKANFTIKNYSSSGGSNGGFTTFDATSPKWDVSVVSGKGALREPSALSIQVATRGSLSDNLNELRILDNPDAALDPNDPNAATSTTTIPLNGG